MNNHFKLAADPKSTGCLKLHPDHADWLGDARAHGRTIPLRFGAAAQTVRIVLTPNVDKNEAMLSRAIARRLRIPLHMRYQMKPERNGDGIVLGPCIGFLLTRTKKDFDKNLPRLSGYARHMKDVGGTVIAFPLAGVNRRSESVEGVVFNPATGRWEKGTFGYPASFFIQSKMIPGPILKHFEARLGKRIFNNFNFDKWKMYRLLQQAPDLRRHLPPTVIYREPGDVRLMLERHGGVYVKPVAGSRGRGVIRIMRRNGGFTVQFRQGNANRERQMSAFRQLGAYLRRTLRPGAYIVQKAVELTSLGGRIVDFRTVMVKGEDGGWNRTGFFARFGAPDSVVSNISAGGSALRGDAALKQLFRLGTPELAEQERAIADLSMRVAGRIDECGVNCGNMGVDIGIDKGGRLWILEIQHNNPDPTLALDARDADAYANILRHHLLYLKNQAGFGTAPSFEGGEV